MADDLEELSRLLDGDLPPQAAEALRARMAADPALARRWQAMSALPDALRTLPQRPMPAALTARVLRLPRRRRWASAGWVAMIAAAAAAILWMGRPRPPTVVVLTEGRHEIIGVARVELAEARVEIDGTAWIAVEPIPPLARTGSEEGEMKTKQAVGGILVSVAVVAGSASVYRADAGSAPETVVVRPGETWQPDGSGRPHLAPKSPTASPPSRADLEQELEKLQATVAFTQAQLASYQGRAHDWPADPAWQPEQVVEAARHRIERGELVTTDCEEFPCVLAWALDPTLDGADIGVAVEQARSLSTALSPGGAEVGLSVDVGYFPMDGVVRHVVVAAHYPKDLEADLEPQVEPRMEAAMDALRDPEEH